VSQEVKSIFWEVIVLVILSKRLHMYVCSIQNSFQDGTILLYISLDLALIIVLPSCMWICVKRHLAIVAVDSDIGVLWKTPHIFTNAEYADMLHAVFCPHTNCKVHWCWRWNFWKCIILGKLYQLYHLNNKYEY
jgi:hypothetical protein